MTKETLVDVVLRQAESDRTWLVLPEDPSESDLAQRITFASMVSSALAFSEILRDRVPQPGRAVGIILNNGEAFCRAFFGALLGGMVPVPIHPPYLVPTWNEYVTRVQRILHDARANTVVVEADPSALADELKQRGIEVVAVKIPSHTKPVVPPRVAPDDTALIQFSSGSTRHPRGAELSHRSVIANVRGIGRALHVQESDIIYTWLPLFHDMGLTGSLLYSFYWGLPIVLMSPVAFVQRPASWLWAISRFGCTSCAAPNFAYALCTSERRVPEEQLKGLDLSCWRDALNGSEMVLPATVEAFARRYERFGLPRSAIRPVYGLAENVVAACFSDCLRVDPVQRHALEVDGIAQPCMAEDNASVRRICSVGKPLDGQEVRVVDELGMPLAERSIGYVQIRGACVMKGYCNHAEETVETIVDGGWLRTGDLGYIVDGELYLTGRHKEIIKRNGARYDAADIQSVVSNVDGVRPGSVAAFGAERAEHGTEEIIVLAETRLTETVRLRALIREIGRAVAAEFGVKPDAVHLVAVGSLPKSTSGKIQNTLCRRRYLDGMLDLLDAHSSSNTT